MAILTAKFEKGINGGNVLTTDPGDSNPWDLRSVTAGSIKYDNTHIRSGNLAAKLAYNGTSAQTYLGWSTQWGTRTEHYNHKYIYMTAYPSTNNHNGMFLYLSAASGVAGWQIDNTGKMQINYLPFATTTGSMVIPLNKWIRLEWYILHSSTVGIFEMKTFIEDSTSPLEVITKNNINTGSNSDSVEVGCANTSDTVFTYWFDDVVIGATSYPGPSMSNQKHLVDSFSRSVSSDWGTSDSGHVWIPSGTTAQINVNGTKGTFNAPGGGGSCICQTTVDLSTYDATGTFKFSMAKAINNVNRIQFTTLANYYYRIEDTTGNSLSLGVFQGQGPILLSNSASISYTAGDEMYCRFETKGNILRMKIWKVGDAEPGNYQCVGYLNTAGTTSAIAPFDFQISQNNFDTSNITVTIDDIDIITDKSNYLLPFRSGKGSIG